MWLVLLGVNMQFMDVSELVEDEVLEEEQEGGNDIDRVLQKYFKNQEVTLKKNWTIK